MSMQQILMSYGWRPQECNKVLLYQDPTGYLTEPVTQQMASRIQLRRNQKRTEVYGWLYENGWYKDDGTNLAHENYPKFTNWEHAAVLCWADKLNRYAEHKRHQKNFVKNAVHRATVSEAISINPSAVVVDNIKFYPESDWLYPGVKDPNFNSWSW